MDSAELRKTIRQSGIGGMFGNGIELFDKEFFVPKYHDINMRVISALNKLESEGLSLSDYREDGVDCDNWSMWICSEVSKQWAVERKAYQDTPSLAFGTAILPGHEINIAVCEEGIKTWNYGTANNVDLKSIKRVTFK